MVMYTGLNRVLDTAGVRYRESSGWKTRTAHKGGMNTVHGVLWHHTATSASAVKSRNNPTLNYVINGLGYPLCNYLLAYDGSVDIIAAGTGAHAGVGSYRGIPNNDGNRHLIGIEVEGTIGLPWSAAQLESAAKIGAALNHHFGNDIIHIAHYEWAPGRKTDPTGIPGNIGALRSAINRGYWSNAATITPAGVSTPSKTATPKETTLSAEEVKKINDHTTAEIDRLYDRIIHGIKWARVGYNDESLRTILNSAERGAQSAYTKSLETNAALDTIVAAVVEAASSGSDSVSPEQIAKIIESAREGARIGAQQGLSEGVVAEVTVKSTKEEEGK